MHKIIAVVLVGAIALQPQKVEANPAIAAPAVFCLGTAGLGCVLVATTVVGGVVYYVWQRKDGKKTQVRAYSQEPGDFEQEQVIDLFASDSKEKAIKRCKFLAKQRGMKYVDTRKTSKGFQCIAK
jgi:uncharacterized protein YxeA